MRGTVAKRIRKQIYGDMSLRAERKYTWRKLLSGHSGGYRDKDGNKYSSLVLTGKRQEYQDAKRDYVRGIR